MRRLRDKLEADPARPRHLVTVHGEGYRFVPPKRDDATSETEPSGSTRPPDPEPPGALRLGPCTVDLLGLQATWADGRAERLTPAECALLTFLSGRPSGRAPREAIERAIWGRRMRAGDRALDHALARLRAKVEADPSAPRHLRTLRGVGLQLVQTPLPDLPPAPAHPSVLVVGRAAELAAAVGHLDGSGAVGLVGPPGMGRTWLARHLLAARGGHLVDAEGAAGLLALRTRIGHETGIGPGAPMARLADRLGDGLLVLDDLDPASDAGRGFLDAWQAARQRPRLVWTAHAPAAQPGLPHVRIGPLPPTDALSLLTRHAPDGWVARDPEAAARLAAALDHMPLALGLVGPLAALLPADAVAARVQAAAAADPVGGSGGALRGVLDTIWQRLPDDARTLLPHLGALSGPFQLADVLPLLPAGDPLPAFQALVSAGLVVHGDGGHAVLHTTRRFLRGRVPAACASADRAHLDAVLRAATQNRSDARNQGTATALRLQSWLAREARGAAERSDDPVRAAAALSFAARDLRWGGETDTLVDRIDAVLPHLDAGRASRGRLLLHRAMVRVQRRERPTDAAETEAREALACARTAGDNLLELGALDTLGAIAHGIGDLDAAQTAFEAVRAQAADPMGRASAALNLGMLARARARPDAAQAWYEQALGALPAEGHARVRGTAHDRLGVLHAQLGHLGVAGHHFAAALRELDGVGQPSVRARVRGHLGHTRWLLGDHHAGLSDVHAAREAARRLDRTRDRVAWTAVLGRLHTAAGRPEPGAACLRAVVVLPQRPTARAATWCFLAITDAARGAHDEATRSLQAAAREAPDHVGIEALIGWSRALIDQRMGRDTEVPAAPDLRSAGDASLALQLLMQMWARDTG
jgi:DNA-binding winged helix-turn-helix (wHTH) protein/tetratricopeptide (TPR) repeat protein